MQIDLSDCVGEDVPEGWHEVEILSVEPEPTNPGAVIIAMETADGRIAKNWVYHDKIAGRNFLKSFWLACGFQGSSMDTRLLVQCRARVFLEKYQSRKSGCWYSRAVKVEMPASPVKAIPVVEVKKPEDGLSSWDRKALMPLKGLTALEWEALSFGVHTLDNGLFIRDLRCLIAKVEDHPVHQLSDRLPF